MKGKEGKFPWQPIWKSDISIFLFFRLILFASFCLFGAKLSSGRDRTCRNAYRQQSNFRSLGNSAKRISYQTWCGCFCSSSHGRLFMNLFNLLFLCTVIVLHSLFWCHASLSVLTRWESDASSEPNGMRRVAYGNHLVSVKHLHLTIGNMASKFVIKISLSVMSSSCFC